MASTVLCSGMGFGLASLVGVAVPLRLTGLFAGLVVGFGLVHGRFRDP